MISQETWSARFHLYKRANKIVRGRVSVGSEILPHAGGIPLQQLNDIYYSSFCEGPWPCSMRKASMRGSLAAAASSLLAMPRP
jgi:hypothetical protein